MHPPSVTHPLALLCRVGFESDLIEELKAWFQARGLIVAIDSTQPAVVRTGPTSAVPRLTELVFARDLLLVTAELPALGVKDRITPISAALDQIGAFALVSVLAPDSEATKPLAPLLGAIDARLQARVQPGNGRAAAVWMLAGTHALVGQAPADGGARYPGGIPRLKFPREAPSRSTLKLDEAFQVLLTEAERSALLRPGHTAVDLGAAPGGWTYQLVARQMRVTAIDNGRVDAGLMASGLVTHLREDGFRYRPPKPVDWLVCDMVEKPGRVAELVARWFAQGWCRAAVFNLKLPMKRRFEAWTSALRELQSLTAKGYSVRARQLYHDREELTVAVVPERLGSPVGAGSARDRNSPPAQSKRSVHEAAPAGKAKRPAASAGARPARESKPRPGDKPGSRRAGAPAGKAKSRIPKRPR
ncbi:MAG TPA: 23S rRNA (cytidine(2498)-2'-O)-methyltransferase RlmM [Xanthomonadales bacterium]|nr:23S rRNA (cytidine(2498)-2'-O)-methyltransferase RlmM [Xanthomonadales bacterium]